tara:strand:+ start:14302 stop:15402 length:1101 start_codon:yes stop_codon:yes gene_type:complete
MNNYYDYLEIQVLSFVFVLLLVPILKFVAKKVNLQDAPNARKVHKVPVPLVGGMAIVFGSFSALLFVPGIQEYMNEFFVLLFGSLVLLTIGIVDDKINVNSKVKLILQVLLAYYVINSGVRIESFFGVFGIHELPGVIQNTLTMIVIVGVVNSFNLMDGIDGLAAGIAIIGLTAYSIIAFMVGQYFLLVFFASLVGGLFGFLRYNLSNSKKVFMGDAGSLFFGFVLVVSGIMLIQAAHQTSNITVTLSVVIGVLSFPVADSLRVYKNRLKNGYSPFKADKTHFHHLIINLGFKHKMASLFIILIAFGLVSVSLLFGTFFSMTFTVISILFLYRMVSNLVQVTNSIDLWKGNIKKLENVKHLELTKE